MRQASPISVAEYLAGEELSGVKHEYLGGEVHAMAGASNRHNAIATNSLLSLGAGLRGKPSRLFNSDTKVRIEFSDHVRFYYPDAQVVCRPNPNTDHFQDNPVVVVEVLSESTRRTDLVEKRPAYLGISSLKVLIVVEPNEPRVLVHRRQVDGGFQIEHYTGLDAVIPLPEIEAILPLAEIYEQIEFAA